MEKQFNIRVYGILIQDRQILLARENYRGMAMCKFVGGGLEWGEGITDSLHREFMEEWQLPIAVGEFVYMNEFFQQSAFSQNDQLISIYYRIKCLDNSLLNKHCQASIGKPEGIFWTPLAELDPETLTWPIDRMAIDQLKAFSAPPSE